MGTTSKGLENHLRGARKKKKNKVESFPRYTLWKEITFFLCQKLEGHGFLKILFRLELWTTICQNSHLYSRGTFWEVAGKCGCKLGSISLKWSLIFSVNLAVDCVCIVWFISRKWCLIFRTKNHAPLRLPLNCKAKCRHRCLLLMLTCGNCSLNIEVAWRWSRNLISGSSQIIFFLMHEKSSEHIIRSLINECKQFLDFPAINMEPACLNRGKEGGGGVTPPNISLKMCYHFFTKGEEMVCFQ